MNPDRLPQPPEGVLDPQIPWSRINPNSRLWVTLKARLTGRPTDGEHYSSYVNISEADADRLIANMKKDPRGYPSLDQAGGNPVQWMENQRLYQEWLVEAYLEDPFREEVDKKIEEAAVESRVREIQEERKKRKEEAEKKKKPKEEIESVVEDLVNNKPIDVEEISPEVVDVLPYIAPAAEEVKIPEPLPVDDTSTPEEDAEETAPILLNVDIQNIINKYASELEAIADTINQQSSLLHKISSQKRSIQFNLGLVNFILGQQIENYSEAISDFAAKSAEEKTQQTIKVGTKKLKEVVVEPPQEGDTEQPEVESQKQPEPQKQWWEFWKPDSPDKKAEGGVVTGDSIVPKRGEYIPPGIYDRPTVGQLAPGTAVIPFNRNYGKKLLNVEEQTVSTNSIGQAMSAVAKAYLASSASILGDFILESGPFAPFFGKYVDGSVNTLARYFNQSRSQVLKLLGLGDDSINIERKNFYKLWKDVLEKNDWIFGGGVAGGREGDGGLEGEVFKDILTIGDKGEGLRMFGGTNVGKMPAWIPFPKSEFNKLEYSSGFGFRWYKQHSGMDLAGEPGIKIISPFAGKVSMMDNDTDGSGYGKYVEIEHTQPKIFTFYGHMRTIANGMTVGSTVQAGQLIGELGNTGRSTGPHLHWEVRERSGGGQIDPVPFTHKFKPGGGQPPKKKLEDYPEYQLNGDNGPPGTIVRLGRKLFKMQDRDRLGDEVPLESGGTIGSFQWGGIVNNVLTNIVSPIINRFAKPKPRGLKGAQVKRIMHGTRAGVPQLIRATGFKEQAGMIGTGVYGSVKGWVADTYRGAGAWKGIVPGQGPRLDLLVPQGARTLRGATVVSARQANRGLSIADGILSGRYTGAKAQQLLPLLTESTPSMARAFGTGAVKLLGRGLGILNAPVIGDMIMPEGTSSYDQISGPNAYYNAPGYKGPKPVTATSERRQPIIVNAPSPAPSSAPVVQGSSSQSTPVFIPMPIPTRQVREAIQLRRL
jgi:murein DD-endopeptidase MepM/ murein hydrolase activator NlpD